jgi:hypothetical protein
LLRARTLKRIPALKAAEWVSGFAVALVCVASLARAARTMAQPYQVDYGEGFILGMLARMARGLSLYPLSTQPPYVINPYGPVGYYVLAPIVRLFDVGFTAPRLVVFAAGIACASAVAMLVRQRSGSLSIGLAFGALYLTKPVVQYWLPRLRMDFLAMAFSLAGLVIFTKRDRWYLAVPFFVAAFYCKSLFVAAPAACLLYLATERDWRLLFRFSGCLLALAGLVFFVLQRVTGGWFAFHTAWSNANDPFRVSVALHAVLTECRSNIVLIALAFLPPILRWVHAKRARLLDIFSLPLLYFGLSFAAILASGKLGATDNYFLEWEAALCVCAGIGYKELMEAARDWKPAATFVLPASLAFVAWSGLQRLPVDNLRRFSDCTRAYQYVQQHAGDRMLSENIGAVVLAGKEPMVLEPFQWTRAVVGAGWSDAAIVSSIESRQVDLVVLNSPADQPDDILYRWPHEVSKAIQENYGVAATFECTDANFIYVPKR